MQQQSLYLTPFQRKLLQKTVQSDLGYEYRRRIEIMLLADTGQSQLQICKALGCSKETARYWIAKARCGQAHDWRDRPRGRPKVVNDRFLSRLKELASNSPRDYDYPFERWTAQWLSKHLQRELGIQVSARHINRLLVQMELSLKPKKILADNLAIGEGEIFAISIRDLSLVSSLPVSNCSDLKPFYLIP